ncbi:MULTISPECIES: DUF1697 domain-containing protein [unclassified Colwellia]|uniref:DUF1697 domain-containing protein n=1 Tax=unclassified Colwellia TaxID=196834 RepID=UPI0015F3A0BE|nr:MULTISPECIES: DUF1697 domain-containing protein [unclassified Colwellia]MBA6358069.1 DUF1697 domain-containing protein [Colwellia sp. BRX8-3]MBA6361966.1 DUF1697 domain-containing protein [Colwellia sp. BRX8-6]MBA6369741.1 DUF1697 domain-containing protein [Colwellia sp. BRX8-5]MBA6377385.1 DUF1697 domain-containing protein [Colwellia sp. BRX8-2]
MQKFIVLFRGINVGGNNILPMKELVPLLEQSGYESVSSYIQSGNIVLESPKNPTEQVQSIISKNFGFAPAVFSLEESVFSASALNNPYKEFEGKFVHFYFCKNNINLVQDKLNKYISSSEEYTVKGNVLYLYAPQGIGRSKLVANVESCLGQSATGRNLNTINKISTMLKNA